MSARCRWWFCQSLGCGFFVSLCFGFRPLRNTLPSWRLQSCLGCLGCLLLPEFGQLGSHQVIPSEVCKHSLHMRLSNSKDSSECSLDTPNSCHVSFHQICKRWLISRSSVDVQEPMHPDKDSCSTTSLPHCPLDCETVQLTIAVLSFAINFAGIPMVRTKAVTARRILHRVCTIQLT